MILSDANLPVVTPPVPAPEAFTDAAAAVERLQELYALSVDFLVDAFRDNAGGARPDTRFRAFYPEISFATTTYAQTDSRLSFGHVAGPGTYSTTITRPDLFAGYLIQQIRLLIENHGLPVVVGISDTPMPVHFAVTGTVTVPQEGAMDYILRDVFDVPDLAVTHDDIVNGVGYRHHDGSGPLAPFTAPRIDYSLARLQHYTATAAEHFQNHVLFTNYQFYVDEFEAYARAMLADPDSGYTAFVAPGNQVITDPDAPLSVPEKMPQHAQLSPPSMRRANARAVTLCSIFWRRPVQTPRPRPDSISAVLAAPMAWCMVGHCAGACAISQAVWGEFRCWHHGYLRAGQGAGDGTICRSVGCDSRPWPRSRNPRLLGTHGRWRADRVGRL